MSLLRRWWRWGLVTLSLLVVAVFVIFALQHNTLLNAAPATVAIFVVGGHVLNTVKWARDRSRAKPVTNRAQLDLAAGALAQLVKEKLDDEPAARQLNTYEPINLKWSKTNDGVARARTGQLFAKNTDGIQQLISKFPEFQTKRLAILGSPGSGKTTLAILLTMKLLGKERESTDVVPVILSLTEWDLRREHCLDWVARRIAEIYPALRDATLYGHDAPRKLVKDGRVLPVLDGLDELSKDLRPYAINELNELMGVTNGLILTTRANEYREAVAKSGETLAQAVIIELLPVAAHDVISYITQRSARDNGLDRWQAVFKQLRKGRHPDSPVSDVLSTPLMISLARRVFNSGSANSAALTDLKQFPDRATIESYLLNTVVPSLFDEERRHGRCQWTGQQAQQWLSTIATELRRNNTHDFKWWHLYQSSLVLTKPFSRAMTLGLLIWGVGAVVYGITTGIRHGLAYGIVHGLGHGLAFGLATVVTSLLVPGVLAAKRGGDSLQPAVSFLGVGLAACSAYGIVHGWLAATTYGLTDGLVTGIGFGSIVGAGFAFGVWFAGLLAPPGEPTRADLRVIGRSRQFVHTIGVTIINSTLIGLLIGVPSELIRNIGTSKSDQPPVGFWICVSFGLCYGLVIGLIKWVSEPLASDSASTPRSSLISDRALVLFRSILLGITVVTVFAAMAIVQPEKGILYTFITQGGVEGGVMTGFLGLLSGSWAPYRLAHIKLAIQGKLPWRLMAFLEFAHGLNILRHAGDVYQFRYIILGDYLAGALRQPTPDNK